MENRKWKIKNGECRIRNGEGEWEIKNGKWRIDNKKWEIENGEWLLGNGKREIRDGNWIMINQSGSSSILVNTCTCTHNAISCTKKNIIHKLYSLTTKESVADYKHCSSNKNPK